MFRPSNKEALSNDQSDDSMKTESTFCGLLIKGDNMNSGLWVCLQRMICRIPQYPVGAMPCHRPGQCEFEVQSDGSMLSAIR